MGRVQDRVAVVTGAANGLGQAIACRLAEEGARLTLGDIDAGGLEDTVAQITRAGGTAVSVVGDLTEKAPAAQLIQTAVERYGRLDIHSGQRCRRQPHGEDLGDGSRGRDFVVRLNLRSTFLCTHYAVPHMMRQRSGTIVCISSGAREGTPWTAYYQGGAAYSAAKAGVHGFIRDVALELAENGITVNTVAPGPIETERVRANLHQLNETVEYSPNRMTPLRRLGQPVEVAHAVLFLASDEASYITGHTLAVTGGR